MLGLGAVAGGIQRMGMRQTTPSFAMMEAARHRFARNGVRLLRTQFTRGRPRKVHVDFPPKQRSPIAKLDDQYCTLYYVSLGWTTKMDMSRLSDEQRDIATWRRKNKHNWLLGGKLAWPKASAAMVKKNHVCLVFARGFTHELIESFTSDEVLELEKMIPKIKATMDKHAKLLPAQEAMDKAARQKPLGISKYSVAQGVAIPEAKKELLLGAYRLALLSGGGSKPAAGDKKNTNPSKF